MRISDWSSDVCSSDLATPMERLGPTTRKLQSQRFLFRAGFSYKNEQAPDRIRSLLSGMYAQRYPRMKSHAFEIGRASCRERGSVRVDLGGRRISTKKTIETTNETRQITKKLTQ